MITYEPYAWQVNNDGKYLGVITNHGGNNGFRVVSGLAHDYIKHETFDAALAALTEDRREFRAWCRFAGTPQAAA